MTLFTLSITPLTKTRVDAVSVRVTARALTATPGWTVPPPHNGLFVWRIPSMPLTLTGHRDREAEAAEFNH